MVSRGLAACRPARTRVALVVLLGCATVLAGCSGGGSQHAARHTPSPSSSKASIDPAVLAKGKAVIAPVGGGFGAKSLWQVNVADAPVNAASATQISGLTARLAKLYGGNAAFAVYQYGVSWVTVGAHQERTNVKWDNCQNKDITDPPGLFGTDGQFVDVPIPAIAAPSVGTDSELSVYQPSTDTMWDFWKAYRKDKVWHACWGGRIDHVSSNDGAFPAPFGASASGLAREAGFVSINDVEAGAINHAVALSIPRFQVSHQSVWPAARSDGESYAPDAIPEGARMRLDPSIDVDKLGLTPIGTMVAKAAQKYGFIVTDGSGTLTVPAESPSAFQSLVGVDPWHELLGKMRPSAVLANFPWDRVQVLQPGWGQPQS